MDPDQRARGLERVLTILQRRVPWVLLCMVLVAGVAYGISRLQTKKYTATAALVFNSNQLGQQLAGLPAASNDHAQAQPAARVKLVRQGDVAAKTARHLGRGLTEADVSTALRVSARGESNVVSVAATASSARLAAAIANAYTKEFVAERQSSDHAFYASVLKRVTKRLRELSSTQRA